MQLSAVIRRWSGQHARAAISSLGRMRLKPAGSLMTGAAIGIALALPAAFLVAMDNLESVMQDWGGAPRASVFLDSSTESRQQTETAGQIDRLEGIGAVRLITPEEALAEYRDSSGMSDAIALLEDNPLPPVVVAELATGGGNAAIDELVTRIRELPSVDTVRLDREWLERLGAIVELGNRTTALIALLLGLTVVLVLFNTIRLDIENNRREIEITKLIGGTDGFIRRPFLYTGLWYGLAGGFIASAILAGVVMYLVPPVDRLATLYGSDFRPAGAGFAGTLTLVGSGGLLGLAGAWLAAGRRLSAIEPP
ncbi:permease-like cell division protein FtsX [Spiribacter vilamensis]|uniref:Cell division protein FtsX n=1 Tax=Spiribacter vilamensis TaxID=531306 RepID=A0A4Q8D211_9GAMM|nr:permease-like cell division protein FtsX [Spiribacter vilamensis]RZU99320.1 cell division protein FtsX [Spiribacter vilamensis]TVO61696.1 ABC transporter permease [Spiribacter vilamensis]